MSYEKFKDCMDACFNCALECRHCLESCLKEEDIKILTRCIRINNDCAAICNLTATLMAGDSEFVNEFLQLCTIICDDCAIECGKHSYLEHCKRCAEASERCSEEYRETIWINKVQVAY